jgi:hypothetical protein
MRRYKVNRIDHCVYEDGDILPDHVKPIIKDWRSGRIGDWVQTDDDCVIQVLRRGSMMRPKGKKKTQDYVGTCTGTFPVGMNAKMDSSRRTNIYSFSGEKKSDDILLDRKELTKGEIMFVLNITHHKMNPIDAYMQAFPTKNIGYATQKAAKLITTKRIQTAMKEELKPIMQDLGIDETLVLKGIKSEAMDADKADTRLKALFKLSDILDLEDKNKVIQTTQIAGVFKGFTEEQVEQAERKALEE